MHRGLRWLLSLLVGLTLVGGVGAGAAQAEDPASPAPVRASIQGFWQARSNFARSNFARSNFARSNFGTLGEQTPSSFGLESSPSGEVVQRALDGAAYQCGPTGFDAYVDGLLAGLTSDELSFLLDSGVLEFPAMEAVVYGTANRDAVPRGHDGHELTKTLKDLQKFWPTTSRDLQLVSMDGEMLRDPERISRLLVRLYAFTPADADGYAAAVARVIRDVRVFDDGESPLFSLNAFAFSGVGDPDPSIAALPPKIVVGEGFLDALDELDVDDVGGSVVLAHEYAHQLQVQDDLFGTATGPEANRRVELMADAFAGYFAVHPKGLSLNARRVTQVQQTFFELGDCSFDDPGHHGTPEQGRRASAWAATLASSTKPRGQVLPAAQLAALFDEELPVIVAADAPVADVPVADVPVADVPVADVPVADVPVADVPVSDVPAADVPVSDVPVPDVQR